MTIPAQALGPRKPYKEWFDKLDPVHQLKEQLRSYFMELSEQGDEIPVPVVFDRDSKEGRWLFEYECPCLLWPDDIPNKQRVLCRTSDLEGAFECTYCGRAWHIVDWGFTSKDHQEVWHPRVLIVQQGGTVDRLRLLTSNEAMRVDLPPDSTAPTTMKLALLLRTLDDE